MKCLVRTRAVVPEDGPPERVARSCGGHLAPDHDEARPVYERACVNCTCRYVGLEDVP